jgi:hypothetical protein
MSNETKKEMLPRPARRKLWFALLLTGIFLGGMVVGGGLTVAATIHRLRETVREPDKAVVRMTKRLDRTLDLTDEQEAGVKTIVRGTLDDLIAQRIAVRRRTLFRLAAARREMDAVLTPEQRQKLDERFETLRKLWGVEPEENEP